MGDSIIHRIFTGALQSDVTCSVCSSVSTTIDPFWDMSLDIQPILPTPQKPGSGSVGSPPSGSATAPPLVSAGVVAAKIPHFPANSHKAGAAAAHAAAVAAAAGLAVPAYGVTGVSSTLEECIQRYTRAEKLNAKISCSKCGTHCPATKQMSLSKLPLVICFHLKRFKHDTESTKIFTPVTFPEVLDLRPYLSDSINAEKDGYVVYLYPWPYPDRLVLPCFLRHLRAQPRPNTTGRSPDRTRPNET